MEQMSWLVRLRSCGLAAQLTILVAAALVVYAVVAPLAGYVGGPMALVAAATAAALCLLGAASALVACRAFRDPKQALSGLLVGMALRMGIPLFSALAVQVFVAALAEAYVLIYFLVFYPVTLFVETILSLPADDPARRAADVSRNAA